MTTQPRAFKSLFGRFGLGPYGQLVIRGINISQPAADATITVSAEGATVANTRDLSITLKDAHGIAIDYAENFEIYMYTSSAMVDFVAVGGSTGVVQGAAGKLLAIVAKKIFAGITSTSGVWTGTYLDTGTDIGYLAVKLPNGRVIGGGVVTCA